MRIVRTKPADPNNPKDTGQPICKIHQSPKELPIARFADWQKYLLQASGIGSTVGDIQRHMQNLHSLIDADQKGAALQEVVNMMYNMNIMLNRISIKSFAFACMVVEFPVGTRVDDFSEPALEKLCDAMSEAGLTYELVAEELSAVKKNSILL